MTDNRFPDFYIIGAAKAGTTSLVDMLRQREGVFFPHEKEPHHFFLREDERDWTILDGSKKRALGDTLPYGDEASYLKLYSGAPEGALRGDASTNYLVNAMVPGAIAKVRPDAKIIVVLREPAGRAYSAWLHARSRGEDGCAQFADALDECVSGARETSFATNYVTEGEYDRHLANWKAVFGDQLLVLLFEDLIADPQAAFDAVLDHLGLSRQALAAQQASHKNASVEISNPVARAFRMTAKRLRRSAPGLFELPLFRGPYEFLLARLGKKPEKLGTAERERLKAHYASHIEATEGLIGRDLSGWKS
ncbi:MAG: sulfotransferase [Erythrobacter sp.]|nr:sulfotransferase [Erythrobacter sp.]